MTRDPRIGRAYLLHPCTREFFDRTVGAFGADRTTLVAIPGSQEIAGWAAGAEVIEGSPTEIVNAISPALSYFTDHFLIDEESIAALDPRIVTAYAPIIESFRLNARLLDLRREEIARNIASNIGVIGSSFPLATLRPVLLGKAALVIAAGPSIDEQIDTIGAHTDRFIIFAALSSLALLRRTSITPDFILTVESVPAEFDHVEGLDSFAGLPLIFSIKSDPRVVAWHHGPKYLAVEDKAISRRDFPGLYAGFPVISGGSVTNFSIAIAVACGMNPVVVSGMDLAITKPGASHYEGARINQHPGRNTTGYTMHESVGKDGATVLSRNDYLSYGAWLETKALTAPGSLIVSTGRPGLLVKNILNADFSNLSGLMPLDRLTKGAPPRSSTLGELAPGELQRLARLFAP